jgi:hypothetical protein
VIRFYSVGKAAIKRGRGIVSAFLFVPSVFFCCAGFFLSVSFKTCTLLLFSHYEELGHPVQPLRRRSVRGPSLKEIACPAECSLHGPCNKRSSQCLVLVCRILSFHFYLDQFDDAQFDSLDANALTPIPDGFQGFNWPDFATTSCPGNACKSFPANTTQIFTGPRLAMAEGASLRVGSVLFASHLTEHCTNQGSWADC